LRFLEPLYPERELANWAKEKFSVTVDPKEMMIDADRGMRKSAEEIADLIEKRAHEA